MSGKSRIVVTRELSKPQLRLAEERGLESVVCPAVRIEYREDYNAIIRKLEHVQDAVWAFTSRNAVEVLMRMGESGMAPYLPRQIFAVGQKTAEALETLGITSVSPARQDGTGLADLILDSRESESLKVVHWHGNRARSEMKEKLGRAGVEVVGLEVYRTELQKIDLPAKPVEGVLFFSPSGVEAYRFSGGFGNREQELFAIGATTGEAVSLESGGHVHIPSTPSVESLLELAAQILNRKTEPK
ncbi:MAG: uroporphyrinogen-III synthase [Balneolaceae bacterium]